MNRDLTHMTGRGTHHDKDAHSSAMSGSKAPARLCYVDDSRTSAYVVKRLLRPYGYDVEHFESAEPALIALVQGNYDLLITDLKVSAKGMDGDDLVRALRNSGHNKVSNLPVIVITGSTDAKVLAEVYEAGANQIMTKPVNGDELDNHIRRLVVANKKNEVDSLVPELGVDPATAIHAAGAKVLNFESEANTRRKDVLSSDVLDNIPVLNIDDQGSKKDQPRAVLTLDEGQPAAVPQPMITVKPAARVTPTIGKSGAGTKSPINTDDVVDGGVSVTERPAKTKLVKTSTQRARVQKTREELLRQRALAKRAVQEKIQAAKVAAQNKASKANSTTGGLESVTYKKPVFRGTPAAEGNASNGFVAKSISDTSIPLTLEPKDSEVVDPFVVSQNAKGARPIRPQNSNRQSDVTNSQAQSAAPKAPVQQPARPTSENSERPSGSGPANAQPQRRQSAAPEAQTEAAVRDILKEMEMYPLVEAQNKRSAYSPARTLSIVGSLLELYGPKKIITTAVVMIALAFAYKTYQNYFDDGIAVHVTPVEQGEIFQSITVPGKVTSKLRVNITPAISGRLTNVYVEEGDAVKTGDLLASLDDREAKSALKRSTSSFDSAKEDVQMAERTLKRLRVAFSKGAVARQLVEDAEVELRSTQARANIAEEEVRTTKLSLENPRIVAPFAGTVTSRFVEVGQWVVPSETLFTLIDQSQREIEVQVDAADSGGIAVGQTVSLNSDAFPGLEWTESVTRLAAATNSVGNANTITVIISLGINAPSLRIGQQVDANIRTAWNPNAIKVPYGAVISRNGGSWVGVVEDGRVHLVQVTTGIEDFSHVEILQGITVGQQVVIANGMGLQNGQRVHLVQNAR